MKFSSIKKSIAASATVILFLFVNAGLSAQSLQETGDRVLSVTSAVKTNSTTVDLLLNNKYHLLLDFYNDNIFRVFF